MFLLDRASLSLVLFALRLMSFLWISTHLGLFSETFCPTERIFWTYFNLMTGCNKGVMGTFLICFLLCDCLNLRTFYWWETTPNPPISECLNYIFLFLHPWKHARYTLSSFFLIICNQIELITHKLCYENSAQYLFCPSEVY